ncbi:multidrug efflux SMR transporter [Aneurinibacillus sp. Ricciae_BoGa-3]|uniref:DMT family transporter n=1 Tax=Aneurinibacillus sp. Ricciae_BoGa-3 TaxID=3022697 RepID=UPI002340204B|nr:multidrug efflux SMR transporter [Aneurinibacillus sp. Ricciae_BoGa-3]WCK54905.1 multidrug efflux SMR transporter [Aneurinibacillus sp. Ricciae_BoGa-3]
MGWLYLSLAILFELSGTLCMKLSGGFQKLLPSILMFFFYILAFSSLTFALKKIEIGIAYAIWSGVGTALIGVIGILYFNESVNVLKIGSLLLVILGVVGLNASSLFR